MRSASEARRRACWQWNRSEARSRRRCWRVGPPPRSSEILLGTKTAGTLAAEIGDTVEGRVGDRASDFRVVGRGVLPDFAISGAGPLAFGNGVAMTAGGMRRLDPQAPRNLLLLGLAATADAAGDARTTAA